MLNFEFSNNLESFSEELILAWFSTIVSLNHRRLKTILTDYPNLSEAVGDNFALIRNQPKTDWLQKFDNLNANELIKEFESVLRNLQIDYITSLNPDFPVGFQNLTEPPIVLFYQGNWQIIQNKQMLTVVGSRNPSIYAKKVLNQILSPVCQLGIGVISGLAYGIDALAHQIAVDKQSSTIGIIGSGLDKDNFYPRENWELKEQIVSQGGLVISEYPPFTPPNNFNFPRRNRLLAVLSEVTWVVQASVKSGSLITASVAQELGKTVATTPGNIYDETLTGNLKLLKDGANYVVEPADLLQLLGLSLHPKINLEQTPEFESEIEKLIWQKLSLEPQTTENLAEKVGLEIQKISGFLTLLEMNSLAICLGENKWIRG